MKTRDDVCLCKECRAKRPQDDERFDTLIIGFNNTRGEVQSALDSAPSVSADPLKMPWAYYPLTRANEQPLVLFIPLMRSVTNAGCLHLYRLIEPEFGARLAPFFIGPARLPCVTQEGALSDLLFQCQLSKKLNPDFYFERAERELEPTEHERLERERERIGVESIYREEERAERERIERERYRERIEHHEQVRKDARAESERIERAATELIERARARR